MRGFWQAMRERRRKAALNHALSAAAGSGDADTVVLLLNQGADLNHPEGWPPHLEAVLAGNPEMVRLLLERGADPNATDPEHQITALMQAAQEGDVAVVRLLLAAGADIHARDWEGRTALTYSEMFPCEQTIEIARILRDAGADDVSPET